MTQKPQSFQETYRPTPVTPQEREHVETITAIMPDCSQDTALSILRRNRGNVEKAVAALLEGDKEDLTHYGSFPPSLNQPDTTITGPRTPPRNVQCLSGPEVFN